MKMRHRLRQGFTLVELLVVIVIIAMLVGLLVPAVITARESARRSKCENNQHEIGLALHQYEAAKKQLPGYVNKFGMVTPANLTNYPMNRLTWAEMIFDYLGRQDLWAVVRDPVTNDTKRDERLAKLELDATDKKGMTIPQFLCPSDSLPERCALSYGVNCGLSDDENADYSPAKEYTMRDSGGTKYTLDLTKQRSSTYGLFFDQSGRYPSYNWTTMRVATDRIPDGAAQTVLFSENCQASQWFPIDVSDATRWPTQPDVGIVWWTDHPDYTGRLGINQVASPLSGPGETSIAPDRFYARPSSNHPGGVMVTFADGHQAFQTEDIDYKVYQQLMTPDTKKCVYNGLMAP